MPIAVIADLHANLPALDAVLADLRGARVDQLGCLGDVAAIGSQPHEVTARLRGRGCPVVLGNTDAAALRPFRLSPADEDGRRYAEIEAWSAAQLTSEDLAYFRTFQPTITIPLGDDAQLLCFHGSPRSNTDSIVATTPDAALARMLGGHSATVLGGREGGRRQGVARVLSLFSVNTWPARITRTLIAHIERRPVPVKRGQGWCRLTERGGPVYTIMGASTLPSTTWTIWRLRSAYTPDADGRRRRWRDVCLRGDFHRLDRIPGYLRLPDGYDHW